MPNQEELNAKYGNNLSVTSNNPQIIQRDQSGNISPELSKTVYIEPTAWKYETDSINQLINTNFNYYTFPPKLILEDVEIPDEFNVESPDIGTKFDSRYKAESQEVPTIELFLPTMNGGKDGINYGWNEISATAFEVPWRGQMIKRWTVGPQIVLPVDAPAETRLISKYYRAQEQAAEEIRNGISTGRFTALWQNGKWFDINSLFEGHFQKIKFTEIIDGLPQTVPGSYKITQDLIDSKKSLQFNIQVAVSHEDNTAKNNFMIRLVRHRTNASKDNPYQVLKIISSAEQGSKVSVNGVDHEELARKKQLRDIYQQVAIKILTQIQGLDAKLQLMYGMYANIKQKAIETGLKALVDWSLISTAAAMTRMAVSMHEQIKQVQRLREALIPIYNSHNDTFQLFNSEYQILLANSLIDPKSPEGILTGIYTNLLPGKTYFNLNYTLTATDMQLNDIYSVEMLGADPGYYPPELIEENTYWDIKEISDTEAYTPESEAANWNNSHSKTPSDIVDTVKANSLEVAAAQKQIANALAFLKSKSK